jgi:type IV pilus assembly protein PilB
MSSWTPLTHSDPRQLGSPRLVDVSAPKATPIASAANRKRRLGELLIDAGLLDEARLTAALSEQRKWGGRLGRTLVEMGFVEEDAMVSALSEQLALPAVDLASHEIVPETLQLLRVDLAERYGVFPLDGDAHKRTLELATTDPTNQEMLKELEFQTGMRIQFSVAGATAIDKAIRRGYYGEQTEASRTATPQEVGGAESLFEIETGSAFSGPPMAPEGQGDLEKRLAEATKKVEELERSLAAQTRVLRSMLELLFDKGLFTREDYLAKVRGPKRP